MKRIFASLLIASAFASSATTPLWLRDVAISPDGATIAFTYKGDIWAVNTGGGIARRLTSQPSYESVPVWSPDSKKIAFATDRFGGQDIMIMDAIGGPATRLTWNSANETPMAFTPDGKNVIFSAAIQDMATSAMFPSARLTEVYQVPIEGGRVTQILSSPAEMIDWTPDGLSFVYQDRKGMENEWRKHHTSSVTRDIWIYNTADGSHKNLTNHAGEDRNPVVSPDGQTLYFLSERDGGSLNVYSQPLNTPGVTPTALTNFSSHPVRFLSQADNGTMALTWDGEIYTLTPGQQPHKVVIDLTLDEADPLQRLRFRNEASEYLVSPDGTQLALVYRGDVFVTSIDHSSMKQVSRTPQAESGLAWSKDSNTLYYTSERDGHSTIYTARRGHSSDPNFSNATTIVETPLFPSDSIERARPKISPDGKKMAFVQDRNRLMVMDLATKAVKQLTDGSNYPQRDGDFYFEWSPDSRWIATEYMARRHDPYADIAIINTTNGEVINLTNSGYFDLRPHWVLDGNAILFLSERYGMRNHASWGSQMDVMLQFLNREAYDKFRLNEEDFALYKDSPSTSESDEQPKPKKKRGQTEEPQVDSDTIVIERNGIENRVVRLTPASADIADAVMTKDGETMYYLASFEQGYDLWKIGLREDEVELVKKLDDDGAIFQYLPSGKVFILGDVIRSLNTDSDRLKTISFSGTMMLDPAREREYMLEFVRNEERQRFYTPDMHGVDWDAMVEAYSRFLPHIDNNYDFSEMLSELLGELNVSHTGSGYYASGAQEPTASLGLLYKWNTEGPGLVVDEVVEGGPFDRAASKMRPGAVITAINGTALTADSDPFQLLNGQSGKKILIAFSPAGSSETIEEVVKPISSGAFNNLLYRRWVKGREHYVDSISGGRLGYVHLQSMSDPTFRSAYSEVLGRFNDREGIVIDTRWNGGGRLHEDIEILFSGKKYFTQVVRGVESCDMPSRRWNKPSIMVICEANYSNAHGTPWVYSHQGLGKLVGAPVPGTMTSVNWVDLQDDSMYFGIPVVGYRLPDGSYLENQQLEPDILILNNPQTVVLGVDDQLRIAVETLLHDIDNH